MINELDRILEEVRKDKDLDKETMIKTLEAALLKAAKNRYGHNSEIEAHLFSDYLRMVPEACFCREIQSQYIPDFNSPYQGLFYYLIAAFSMFVLNQPGHPVGMPFPGGFRVEEHGGVYHCPVRDKERVVAHSICNFCPAKQSELFLGK